MIVYGNINRSGNSY